MKTIHLAAILSSAMLLASGLAQAEAQYDKNVHQQHFVSKRPYMQPLPDSAYQKQEQWEGATLVKDVEGADENQLSQQKALRLNMLSKRPY